MTAYEYTDPAKEFAETCRKLAKESTKKGDEHLAEIFGLTPWSSEFYQIIFALLQRADDLISIVDEIDMDDDIKKDAVRNLITIKGAFSKNSLINSWSGGHGGPQSLAPAHVSPVKMLSSEVRKLVRYPVLKPDEIGEILNDIAQLEQWLIEHQLSEQDFIRQAILEGLRGFRFRLERIEWLGWGYTVASLRDVVAAYMALERGVATFANPDSDKAVLKKVVECLKRVHDKIQVAKTAAETGDFLLRIYGATALVTDGAHKISGYLTSN